jgi:hypothetical protein
VGEKEHSQAQHDEPSSTLYYLKDPDPKSKKNGHTAMYCGYAQVEKVCHQDSLS